MTIYKSILQALLSAFLASLAAIIYNRVYCQAFDVKFDTVLNTGSIVGVSVFACMLIALAYYWAYKWKGVASIGVLNILVSLASFVSIIGVLTYQLPMDIESPELFPGLAIPMHFFPALSYFTVFPFFKQH